MVGDVSPGLKRLDACKSDELLPHRSLIHLAEKCLACDPKDRPADAGVVAKQVDEYQVSLRQRAEDERVQRKRAEAERREKAEQLARIKAEEAAKSETAKLEAVEVARQKAEQAAKSDKAKRWFAQLLAGSLGGLVVVLLLAVVGGAILYGEKTEALGEKTEALGEKTKALADTAAALMREEKANKQTVQALEKVTAVTREEKSRINAENAYKLEKEAKDREVQERMKADRNSYYYSVNLAAREWRANNMDRVNEILDDCPSERRGWEWHYLARLSGTALPSLLLPREEVWAVAYSPDGKRFAVAGEDSNSGEMKIYDATTSRILFALKPHGSTICSVVFSPDGKQLASASNSYDSRLKVRVGEIKLWDAATGKELGNLNGHTGWVWSVAFSPDGGLIASGAADKTVIIWDTKTGKKIETLTGHTDEVNSVAFSPDGQYLASASGTPKLSGAFLQGALTAWNLPQGEIKIWKVAAKWSSVHTFSGTTRGFTSVAFAPDSNRLAAAGTGPNTVRVWDIKTGVEILNLDGHTEEVTSVAFSPDGKLLASGSMDRSVKVWSFNNDEGPLTFRGHRGRVMGVVFRSDSQLTSVGWDFTKPGEVKFWDVTRDQEAALSNSWPLIVLDAKISPDGNRLAVASGMIHPVVPNVLIWDAASGKQIAVLRGHESRIRRVAFSPDGKNLASASEDQTVKVWDLSEKTTLRTLKGHVGIVTSVAYSPDGLRLASGGEDKIVRVWNVGDGKEPLILTGHTKGVNSVAFSPDSARLVSASEDGTIRMWDASTGKFLRELSGHAGDVECVVYSGDGRQIASAGGDHTVKVWDAGTGKELRTFRRHTNMVNGVAFSPDSKRLASVGADGAIRVWDPETCVETLTLRGFSRIIWSIAFSKDGKLVSGDAFGLKVWDGAPAQRPITLREHPSEEEPFRKEAKGGLTNEDKVHLVSKGGLMLEGIIARESPKAKLIPPGNREVELPAKLFLVKMTAGKQYRITLESDEIDSVLAVMNKNQQQIAWDDDSGGNQNSFVILDVLKDDTYKIYAASCNGTGIFSLKVEEAGMIRVDEVGAGLKITGQLGKVSAIMYNVKLAAGKTYDIDMKSPNKNVLDPFLRLLDENGKQLREDDDSGGNFNAQDQLAQEVAGTYQVIATCLGGIGRGEFTLMVREAVKSEE